MAISLSSSAHKAETWSATLSILSPLYSTMLIPSITAPSTSCSISLTNCHTISCFAKLSTVLSIVSTEVAFASTKLGEWRSAESKLSYLILINVLAFAIGVKFSLASQTKANEPSEPVIIRLKSTIDMS